MEVDWGVGRWEGEGTRKWRREARWLWLLGVVVSLVCIEGESGFAQGLLPLGPVALTTEGHPTSRHEEDREGRGRRRDDEVGKSEEERRGRRSGPQLISAETTATVKSLAHLSRHLPSVVTSKDGGHEKPR